MCQIQDVGDIKFLWISVGVEGSGLTAAEMALAILDAFHRFWNCKSVFAFLHINLLKVRRVSFLSKVCGFPQMIHCTYGFVMFFNEFLHCLMSKLSIIMPCDIYESLNWKPASKWEGTNCFVLVKNSWQHERDCYQRLSVGFLALQPSNASLVTLD